MIVYLRGLDLRFTGYKKMLKQGFEKILKLDKF